MVRCLTVVYTPNTIMTTKAITNTCKLEDLLVTPPEDPDSSDLDMPSMPSLISIICMSVSILSIVSTNFSSSPPAALIPRLLCMLVKGSSWSLEMKLAACGDKLDSWWCDKLPSCCLVKCLTAWPVKPSMAWCLSCPSCSGPSVLANHPVESRSELVQVVVSPYNPVSKEARWMEVLLETEQSN